MSKGKYAVVAGVDHGIVDSNGTPHYTVVVSTHRTLRAAGRSAAKAHRKWAIVTCLRSGRKLGPDEWNAFQHELYTAPAGKE